MTILTDIVIDKMYVLLTTIEASYNRCFGGTDWTGDLFEVFTKEILLIGVQYGRRVRRTTT